MLTSKLGFLYTDGVLDPRLADAPPHRPLPHGSFRLLLVNNQTFSFD